MKFGFLLEAPPKTAANISVNFVDFALETSKRCSDYDYVKVYKQDIGSDTWTGITPAYCGARSIPPITAVSQRLLVKFVSDATNNDRGFNATYSIETAKGKSCISVIISSLSHIRGQVRSATTQNFSSEAC